MSLRLVDKLDPLPQFESELSGMTPAVHADEPAASHLNPMPTNNSLLWVIVAMTIGFAIMLGFLVANQYTKLDIRIWQTLR